MTSVSDKSIKDRKEEAKQASYSLTPPFPKEFLIDITSHCNHACLFCSNPRMANKTAMDPTLVLRLLREGYEAGARQIGLYATGEPFLAKRLPEFVSEAKAIGYDYVYITTNGASATPARAKAVIDAGLDSIKFSMHGATRESYRHVHGKDDFDRVMANLKWIADYRKESGRTFKIYVTMVQTAVTVDEIEALHQLVKPYIDEWDPHLLTNSCGTMPENNEIGVIEANNIRGRGHKGVCFQPFSSFTITPEGYLSGCVLDYHKALVVADLNETSLVEAWHNATYQDWRRRHLEGCTEGSICDNCINNTDRPYTPLLPTYFDPPVKPPRR